MTYFLKIVFSIIIKIKLKWNQDKPNICFECIFIIICTYLRTHVTQGANFIWFYSRFCWFRTAQVSNFYLAIFKKKVSLIKIILFCSLSLPKNREFSKNNNQIKLSHSKSRNWNKKGSRKTYWFSKFCP